MFSKFLDPKNDIAFKRIFGSEKNKDILIHFINDMITFKNKEPIKEVTFLKNSQDPEIVTKKTSIVDILCKDEKGNTYIVEMQVARNKGFEKRAQYYASKAYISQANVGGQYEDLQEIIFLAISDFTMFPNKIAYKSDHVILDKETYENDLKDFSFTFLELPKFTKTIDQLSDMIDKWAYFFKHAAETSRETPELVAGQDHIIERAYEQLNHVFWSEEELCKYEQAEKSEKDYAASMAQKFDEGIEKGEKRGLEKGKKIGIEEGARLTKLRMTEDLIKQGADFGLIRSVTGFSENEITALKEEMAKQSLEGKFEDYAIRLDLAKKPSN